MKNVKSFLFMLLACLFLPASGVYAQNDVRLKFERTGTDVKSVTCSVIDEFGAIIPNATAQLVSVKNKGTDILLRDSKIPGVLCPNANLNGKPSIVMEFEIQNLPSFAFSQVGLDIHPLSGKNIYHDNPNDGNKRCCNVTFALAGTPLGTRGNIELAGGVGESNNVHKYWKFSFNQAHSIEGTVKIQLTINADNVVNSGSYFGLAEILLTNRKIMANLKPISGDMVNIPGAKAITSFSAPVATNIPNGVTAYYITAADNNSAKLTPITGMVIPANEGVILTSDKEQKIEMTQTKTKDVLEGNLLKPSLLKGTTHKLLAGDFVLGKIANDVGFFSGSEGSLMTSNKAYLQVPAAQSASIKLVLDGETTGIEQLEQSESVEAPIYDLSGRRVVNTVKGGIYIQNGKKFIVK